MPPVPSATGLTITNPLVLYRTLVATKRLEPDPVQHRLAIHLQKLYHRLKDYQPEVDFAHKISQLNHVLGRQGSQYSFGDRSDESLGKSSRFKPFLTGKADKDATALTRRLTDHESAIQAGSPQGLLLYGEVGTGKSLLIDLLAESLPNLKKRRWHFNTFMLSIFAQLEALRKRQLLEDQSMLAEEHSMLALARELISTSPILFLDEFQLPDRAASKILATLFTSFFHLGGVLIATSNRMPEELANASGIDFAPPPPSLLSAFRRKLGLPRHGPMNGRSETMFSSKSDFSSFLEVLKARCEVWDMEGKKDWRRREVDHDFYTDRNVHEAAPGHEMSNHRSHHGLEALQPGNIGLGFEQSQMIPSTSSTADHDANAGVLLPQFYISSAQQGAFIGDTEIRSKQQLLERRIMQLSSTSDTNAMVIPQSFMWQQSEMSIYGRKLVIPRSATGVTKWTFQELCGTNLGPADYISLASSYSTFIITDVPVLNMLHKNEARRLITLLDALYEARCKLMITAEAGPDDLFFPESKSALNSSESNGRISSPEQVTDQVYSETLAEIYQDQTSPFRPNISSYESSASSPAYAGTFVPSSASQSSTARSILADEDSDFGPVYGAGRYQGQSLDSFGSSQDRPNFAQTGLFTGEDEKFAYKRARSRLWEMCGARWWARDGDWWKPLSLDARHWESSPLTPLKPLEGPEISTPAVKAPISLEESTSPFRTSREPPPKLAWTHAWGMMTWGKKAGAWGQGPAGLSDRKKSK